MQHRNIWKQDVLQDIDSEDIVDSIEGVIANSGVAVEYYAFNTNTGAFGEKLDTYAFIQSKDTTQEGVVFVERKLDIIMPTEVFKDNSITPTDRDKLIIGDIAYYMSNIIFYARDGRSETIIENSVLVKFDAIKREGMTRNNLID